MRIARFPDSAIDFGNVTKHFETHHFDLLSVEDQDGGNRKSGKKEVPNSSSMPDFPDENEQKVHQAHLILGAGLPISLVDGYPWREFCKQHNLRHWTRKTITRKIEDLQTDLLTKPLASFVDFVRTPVFFNVLQFRVLFVRLIYVGNDGWVDRRGRSLDSFVVSTGRVVLNSLGKSQLRPFVLPVALRRFEIDTSIGESYDASKHGLFVADVLKSLGLPPKLVLAMVLDTTYSNPKMTETRALADGGIANEEKERIKKPGLPKRVGVGYAPCGQHVDSLIGQDLSSVPLFKEIAKAEKDVTVFIRGSDSRMTQLEIAFKDLQKSFLMPLNYPVTRFLYSLIALARTQKIFPAYKTMLAKNCFGDPGNGTGVAREFRDKITTLEALMPQLDAVVDLVQPLLKYSASFGSTRQYTTSIQQVMFIRLLHHADEFAETSPGKTIRPIINQFRASLYERLASVQSVEYARKNRTLPEEFTHYSEDSWETFKTGALFPRKVASDDRNNAAAYLDVAIIPYWIHMGGSTSDARGYFIRLLSACVIQERERADFVVVPNPDILNDDPSLIDLSNDAQPAQKKARLSNGKTVERNLRIEYSVAASRIRSKKKPDLANVDEWDTTQREKLRALGVLYKQQGVAVEEIAITAAYEIAVENSVMDVQDWIADTVTNELARFNVIRSNLLTKYNNNVPKDKSGFPFPSEFGDPLDLSTDVASRYEFWPTHSNSLPLLNFCAEILLGGMGASTENESFHSLSGYIMNKLRSRMKVDTLEGLALSKYVILERLKAEAKKEKVNDIHS